MNSGHVARLTPVLALAGALVSGAASAQSPREQALEARVAELERMVQQLIAERQAERSTLQSRPVAATGSAGAQPSGATTLLLSKAAPNTTVKLGGFFRADFLATRTSDGSLPDNSNARALYIPGATPVDGRGSDTDFDAHAKFTRLNLSVDTVTDSGNKAGGFLELDFFGSSLGSQSSTNTYGATFRHAYMYWNNLLAGQTWTNFGDAAILPETADFIGPTDGVVFVRQAQLRYTMGAFSASLENPETTFNPYLTGSSAASDDGEMPDVTFRYSLKGDWGSFGAAALLRKLEVENSAFGSDDAWGGGVTVGGKVLLSANDDIRFQLTGGEGISRYIGLGINADATIDASGDLDTIGVLGGYIAWQHRFSPAVRTNLVYARSDYDNQGFAPATATKSVHSLRANIFYSPFSQVDLGAELMFGQREVESGDEGDITRLQFTTKYNF